MKRWAYRVLTAVAIAYPATLVVAAIVMYWKGETWWVADLALYLPRVALAAPLPLIVIGLLAIREHRLLLTQAFAALVILFPLMGFVLPVPALGRTNGPHVRVLSYNVNSGYSGDGIIKEIERFSPDIVFLQETNQGAEKLVDALRNSYADVRSSTQFIIASRFPILAFEEPDRIPLKGAERSPRFVRQVLDTPLGHVAFYHVHPISPRMGIYRLRGAGLRREILSGRIFTGERSDWIQETAELRERQVHAFTELAANESDPVIIVGDTNLPGLSAIYRRYLSVYHDAFREAGWGFGYTFPTNRFAWMRLDRILASEPLKFIHFEVGQSTASDHYCVVADIVRR